MSMTHSASVRSPAHEGRRWRRGTIFTVSGAHLLNLGQFPLVAAA